VWIELDVGAESIAGAIHRGEDPARPFTGWLELVALLEAVRRPVGADGLPPPSCPDGP
jgi:hypothetical protein